MDGILRLVGAENLVILTRLISVVLELSSLKS
jgi:hypothetical protein